MVEKFRGGDRGRGYWWKKLGWKNSDLYSTRSSVICGVGRFRGEGHDSRVRICGRTDSDFRGTRIRICTQLACRICGGDRFAGGQIRIFGEPGFGFGEQVRICGEISFGFVFNSLVVFAGGTDFAGEDRFLALVTGGIWTQLTLPICLHVV